MGIPTALRVRSGSDFQKVRSARLRAHCGPFILNACIARDEETSTSARLGVIASRRVGNAVKRNRGKRLMRELFRLHRHQVPSTLDLVAVLRSGYDRHSFAELEERFLKGTARLAAEARVKESA